MAFLVENDYEPIINMNELNIITGNSSVVRQQAESLAMNKIKHLISGKVDIDAVFNAEDTERDLTMIEYTIYYTLYILYTKIAKVKVPADRYAQYREASEFFKSVASDLIQTNLPRKAATETDDFIDFQFSSDEPYDVIY